MKLPDDIFKQELLQYLTIHDVEKLDIACMNHKYRLQLLDKINGVILRGENNESMKASLLFKWLGLRGIYLINIIMKLNFEDNDTFLSILENEYMDQFRYTQHVFIRGPIRDDIAILIISHCPCLLSINISGYSSDLQVTDHALLSIPVVFYCSRLQKISLGDCRDITDAGLIAVSEHCPNLQVIDVYNCSQITDTGIISISTHCTRLQSLTLENCHQITDASIISTSTHWEIDYRKIIGIYLNFDGKLLHSYFTTVSEVFWELIAPNLMILLQFR